MPKKQASCFDEQAEKFAQCIWAWGSPGWHQKHLSLTVDPDSSFALSEEKMNPGFATWLRSPKYWSREIFDAIIECNMKWRFIQFWCFMKCFHIMQLWCSTAILLSDCFFVLLFTDFFLHFFVVFLFFVFLFCSSFSEEPSPSSSSSLSSSLTSLIKILQQHSSLASSAVFIDEDPFEDVIKKPPVLKWKKTI